MSWTGKIRLKLLFVITIATHPPVPFLFLWAHTYLGKVGGAIILQNVDDRSLIQNVCELTIIGLLVRVSILFFITQ